MRRAAVAFMVFAAAISLGGCMSARSAAEQQADNSVATRVASEFERRVAADSELKGWVRKVSDVTAHRVRGWVDFNLMLDGKRWTEITRPQQERILRKIGNHLKDAYVSVEPGARRQVNAMVHDDTGLMGVIITNGDDVSYNVRR
jgi:hypothetical protein